MFTRKMVDRTLIRRNKERTYWHLLTFDSEDYLR